MENNKIKGIIFIDNKENGYGNIDAVRDDEKNLIIPTKQQKEKCIKIYVSVIEEYLKQKEKEAKKFDEVLKKLVK